MTPAARYAAAIGILDDFLSGEPAEKTLSNWARSNRYAGSKDRAAVRDIVFDCLRCLRSYQGASGFSGGRGLVLGHMLANGLQPDQMFSGEGYAPSPLSVDEIAALENAKPLAIGEQLDIPDWLVDPLQQALGVNFEAYCKALQQRAPVDLRVNLSKTDRALARTALAEEDILCAPVKTVATALRVQTNPRRVALSMAYREGLVELQDAASQAVVADLPLDKAQRVLDYCAGGGGKTLAMAAIAPKARLFAHDASPSRLAPLVERAERAGAKVQLLKQPPDKGETFDLVLLDVPCSGSGAWRRNPEGKWRFSLQDLDNLNKTQSEILQKTESLVAKSGYLAYVTCSVLQEENELRVAEFCQKNQQWQCISQQHFKVGTVGDGFFLASLRRR